MGNCLALSRPKRKSCAQAAMCSYLQVLRIVKTDGNILEYTRPMLVKDVLTSFSTCTICLSEIPLRPLPLNYELKVGHVYYLLPSGSAYSPCSTVDGVTSGTKRMKMVITKQQLRDLLSKKITVEDMVLGFQKRVSIGVGSRSRWRPVLATIPEGSE